MTRSRRSILLVEDSPDDAEFAARALRKLEPPCSIDIARDGEDALDHLFGPREGDSPRALPVLVLLDIKLPKVDGFEVLRRIRQDERTRWTPTVMLSSSGVQEDIEQAYALGANGYVRKPVEFTEYSEALMSIGHYWIYLNEVVPGRGDT